MLAPLQAPLLVRLLAVAPRVLPAHQLTLLTVVSLPALLLPLRLQQRVPLLLLVRPPLLQWLPVQPPAHLPVLPLPPLLALPLLPVLSSWFLTEQDRRKSWCTGCLQGTAAHAQLSSQV